MKGAASDIFLRNAPMSPEVMSEIQRISGPGTNITIMQEAATYQGTQLRGVMGSSAQVVTGPVGVFSTGSAAVGMLNYGKTVSDIGYLPIVHQILRMVGNARRL